MFLFTQTNRLKEAEVAAAVVPGRVRSVEAPAVCVVGAVLLTRPKGEVRSRSES